MRWLARAAPLIGLIVPLVTASATARADGGDDPAVRVDAGLLVAPPAALPAGLSRGLAAGATSGGALAWGASASWSTATEYSTAFRVSHADVRLHAIGALQHTIGRGNVALRLGIGGTLVHEKRRREQGERAGLTGDELETTALRLLPSAQLEAAVALGIAGDWSIVVRGGPTINLRDGVHGGWTGMLGAAWTP